MNTVIVLAGGFGTRLRAVISDIPKPMAPVQGRPFLEFILDGLAAAGCQNIVLSVGYMHEVIQAHFGDCYKSMSVLYSIENTPLGTGGGIKAALDLVNSERVGDGPVTVLNGDTRFAIDMAQLEQFHADRQSLFTLALRRVNDADRYGNVEVDADGKIVAFAEKQAGSSGVINGGIYVVERDVFERYAVPEAFSIERDFLERYASDGMFYGMPFDAPFIDIGLPEDYNSAQEHAESWSAGPK
jgi:D-glycero-alpha-D-manno-heptose 1-phosphate guanylyltransferase